MAQEVQTQAQQPRGTNGMAVASLVCSLLGLAGLAFIGPILGLVLGMSAKKEIARTGEEGEGLAQAGIIISIIQLVLYVLGLIALLGFFLFIVVLGAAA